MSDTRTGSGPSSLRPACNSLSFYYRCPDLVSTGMELLGIDEASQLQLRAGVPEIMSIAVTYSMRVSEVLALTASNTIGGNRMLVKALKGSSSYIIYLPDLDKQIARGVCCQKNGVLFELTYSHVYRSLQRLGYGTTKDQGRNKRVTHLHRSETAGIVNEITDSQTAGEVLHHKSVRSIKFYLQR